MEAHMSEQRASQLARNPATAANSANGRSQLLHRPATLGEHVAIQRDAGGPVPARNAEPLVQEVLDSPGRPLDSATRSSMESQLGYDFSSVRIHTDERAANSAQAVSANAYTSGDHVVFGGGRYQPSAPSGQQLLAHELTHVVQQSQGPVSTTPVTEGLSISHPSDRFEASARQAGAAAAKEADVRSIASPAPAKLTAHAPTSAVLQRDVTDNSGTGDWQARQTAAGEKSANAGVASAAFGGVSALGALVSGFEAIRQAAFAERSAAAAEDPPVQEPTTGGVNSTHNELPEVKGINVNKPEKNVETVEITEDTHNEPVKKPAVGKKKEYTVPGKKTTRVTSKDGDEPDKPDQEKRFTVLRLAQGLDQKESAEFLLTLRYNGKDVRGGTTEDGDIDGYLGGTAQSNASVTFKGSPGLHQPDGTATVRLLFGGTNVPPRKTPPASAGFWGLGLDRAKENKDYVVQRFSTAVRFSGKGDFLGFDRTPTATPRDRSSILRGDGKDPTVPLVTVRLMDSGAGGGFLLAKSKDETTKEPLSANQWSKGAAGGSGPDKPK
jgi:hypothetical protein